MVAAAVSFLIGEQIEAAVIAAIVVLNAVLGFVQEAGAERAVMALRQAVELNAMVVRGGRDVTLPARELVPGDLILLARATACLPTPGSSQRARSQSTSRR